MKQKVLTLVPVLVALILLSSLSGCGGSSERLSLKVAEASQPMFTLVYIAENQGYFNDENLDVTLV